MRENKYKYVTNSQKKKKNEKNKVFAGIILIICIAIIAPIAVKLYLKSRETVHYPLSIDVTTEEATDLVISTEETTEQTTNKVEASSTETPKIVTTESTDVKDYSNDASKTETSSSSDATVKQTTIDDSDSFTYSFGTISDNHIYSINNSDYALVFQYISGEKDTFLSYESDAQEMAYLIEDFMKDNISDSMTDYDKELAIHDYLVKNISYTYIRKKEGFTSPKYSAYGALVNHQAVCQGYAEAFELMCACCGIKCHLVSGEATNDEGTAGHAWNMVQLEDNWYHVDVTWDDPIPEKYQSGISHEYFNISDNQISKDHDWNKSDYPECTRSR